MGWFAGWMAENLFDQDEDVLSAESRSPPPDGGDPPGDARQQDTAAENEEKQSMATADSDEVHAEDVQNAKRSFLKVMSLLEGSLNELIAVVLVSGKISLRTTFSGIEIHRLLFESPPPEPPPETEVEKATREAKEQKKRRRRMRSRLRKMVAKEMAKAEAVA